MRPIWRTKSLGTDEPSGLIHTYEDGQKKTVCGKEISERWFLGDDKSPYSINCPRCWKIINNKYL